MSGYRSLHRERILDTAIWNVQATELLLLSTSHSSNDNSNNKKNCWRVWTASADGLVRAYVAQEKTIGQQDAALDASALKLECTHVLLGVESQQSVSVAPSSVLGCTRVCTVRNYVGEDTLAGDLVVLSLELAGKVRIWSFSDNFDDNWTPTNISSSNDDDDDDKSSSPKQVRARFEFQVENATGTTAELCPPRVSEAGNVIAGVGCLDGTISFVAVGLATPNYKKDPSPAGTVLDSWGSQGSAVPLSLGWHPTCQGTLAVGRQDGVVDILTGNSPNNNGGGGFTSSNNKKNQHRLIRHSSPVRALSYTDDGNLLISGSDQGMICIWDVSRQQQKQQSPPPLVHHVIQAHKSWILNLAVLSDSRRFVTAGLDQQLCVWNVGQQMHQPVHTFQTDHAVWTVAAQEQERRRGGGGSRSSSSDQQPRLVTGSDTGWLQVYSIESSK